SVRKELRGDLETVLGKALAKEPERRYATAAEFAEDLRLFLDQRPIRARKPTSLYVGWKFVRRHRLMAATTAALVAALFVAQYFSLRARDEKWAEDSKYFWQQLSLHQSLLKDAEGLLEKGRLVQEGRLRFSTSELEGWLNSADRAVARLDEH